MAKPLQHFFTLVILLFLTAPSPRAAEEIPNHDLALAPPPTLVDFKSIGEARNDQNPNQTIPVDITLKGPWKPTTPSEQTQVLTTSPHQTTLRFIGLHGQSLQVSLSPQVP
jgi:hypothetical protein